MRRAVLVALLLGAWTQRGLAQVGGEAVAGEPIPPTTEDLAQAADATADVAAVPHPAPAAEAAPPAAVAPDDIDLSALGLDPGGAAAFDDKLSLYGFADLGYTALHWGKDPVFFPQDSRGFAVGNLNIYLAKNLTQRARTLAEVRFTFMPNGNRNADGSYIDTSADDMTNAARKTQWGGVVIERAYLEYDVTEHLTVRAGRWLTPYGIWNIDHGSPTVVPINRPYIIGEQFFPERQTGLAVSGSHYHAGFKLGVHLTASNGRGATEATADLDTRLAFGGRVEVETPWRVKLGASYYRGRYTGLPASAGAAPETYLEAAYGGDARYELGALHVQGEVIVRERSYDDGMRATSMAGFTPDSRAMGAYVLAGYRFDRLWNVMPYAYGGFYRPVNPANTPVKDINVGLNFRPAANLVFKMQGDYVRFDSGMTFFAGQRLYVFMTQASWVF